MVMAPSVQPEWAESQTLLEADQPTTTHSYSATNVGTDGGAKTPPLLVPSGRSNGVVVAGLIVFAATVGVVASSATRRTAVSSYAPKTALSHVPGGHSLYSGLESITAHNEYTRQRGFAGQGYSHLSEGMVVEPYRITTLQFMLPEGQTIDSDTQPVWSSSWTPNNVVEHSNEIINTDVQTSDDDGSTIITATTKYNDLGLHLAGLTVYLDDGSSYELSRSLYSHYVRRNIRQLTSTEKEYFFDSFLTMYNHNTSVGQALFGGHFRGLRDFVGAHLAAAGTRNADRFHDGMGFLTQHAALTNEFELSIQSIYPTMAMPFWDYTEDGELVHAAQDLDVAWEQNIWSADWFGNATGEKFNVVEGRFAYQEAYKSDKEGVVTNPYGYMRSPWNMAKSPYVTRVHKFCDVSFGYESWPFCADHYNMTFSSSYDTWYEWVWAGGYVPHGPVHYYIGGYSNCGHLLEEFDLLGLSQAQVNDFGVWMVMLPKNYWRAYATESPEFCSMDAPQDECHMKCLLSYENMEDVTTFMEMMYSFIGDLGESRAISDVNWIANLTFADAKVLMRLYCDTPFSPGEQIEAASPIDVSFWPIHPTMERLLQYKRMTNDFNDTDWSDPDNSTNSTTSYCTETGAYFSENYMGHGFHDDRISSLCEGHHAEDMTMFKSNIQDTETGKYVYRATTNVELFKMINPAEYEASYIYENFEWKHCTDAYTFPSVDWGNVTTYSDTNTDDATTHKAPGEGTDRRQ